MLQQELDRRFRDMQLQLDQRFLSSQDAVQAALKSAELAVNKAEVAAEKRFDNVNEFRQTLSDQTKTFVTEDKFSGLAHQVDLLQGQQAGTREQKTTVNATMILVTQVIIGLISVVSLVIAIVVHLGGCCREFHLDPGAHLFCDVLVLLRVGRQPRDLDLGAVHALRVRAENILSEHAKAP